MDAVVPWTTLLALIEPHYPKAGNGRRLYPLAVMLRIYFLQQWYQLSDLGAEEALYDIQPMRAFAGLELGRDAIPDETTILNFRHLLELPQPCANISPSRCHRATRQAIIAKIVSARLSVTLKALHGKLSLSAASTLTIPERYKLF